MTPSSTTTLGLAQRGQVNDERFRDLETELGISLCSTASPILGGDHEPAVVGRLVEEHSAVASAGFYQAEALKDVDRPLMGVHCLSPDLLQAELVEAIVKACSPGQTPEPLTPAGSLANDKPQLASVGIVSVEIDVADEEPFVDRP